MISVRIGFKPFVELKKTCLDCLCLALSSLLLLLQGRGLRIPGRTQVALPRKLLFLSDVLEPGARLLSPPIKGSVFGFEGSFLSEQLFKTGSVFERRVAEQDLSAAFCAVFFIQLSCNHPSSAVGADNVASHVHPGGQWPLIMFIRPPLKERSEIDSLAVDHAFGRFQ